jgi:hypothetical protein
MRMEEPRGALCPTPIIPAGHNRPPQLLPPKKSPARGGAKSPKKMVPYFTLRLSADDLPLRPVTNSYSTF